MAAILLDLLLGEPPNAVHPVVWMGTLLAWLERRAPRLEAERFLYGAGAAAGAPLAWAFLGRLAECWLPWPIQAAILKSTFAGRALLEAGSTVEEALARHDLPAARVSNGSSLRRSSDATFVTGAGC